MVSYYQFYGKVFPLYKFNYGRKCLLNTKYYRKSLKALQEKDFSFVPDEPQAKTKYGSRKSFRLYNYPQKDYLIQFNYKRTANKDNFCYKKYPQILLSSFAVWTHL